MSRRHRTARRRPARASSLLVLLLVLLAGAGGLTTAAPAGASSGAVTVNPRCGEAGTPAVVALQDPHFYVDSSSTAQLWSTYAGYRVSAGDSARRGLWLVYGGFTGGVVGLAADQPAATALPDLPSGASTTRYAMLTASATTTVAQSHTVTLLDGPPGVGSPVCSRAFTYADVVDTIKALANKVTSVQGPDATAGEATIGDLVTVTVTGNTGTLGAGPGNDPGVLQYTPNALGDFPVSAWRLERTELTISPDGVAPATTFVDRLYLSGASGPARPYTARYLFRAVGPASRAAQVKPIQYIASGTQVKHTDLGGAALYSLPSVSPVAATTLAKTVVEPASGVLPSTGGEVSYELTLTNTGGAPATVDQVEDTMPTDATYVTGSTVLGGRRAAAPHVDGRRLVLPGPVTVPAGGTTTVRYRLLLGPTAGARTNSAVARTTGVVLDATADVTTSSPAAASVTVLGAGGPALATDTADTVAGTPVTVDVLANDTPPSGHPLRVTAVSTPSRGTATLETDGEVTYTPAARSSGTDTFTYTATDGFSTGTGQVSVTVAPLAQPDRYSTGKGTALTASTSVLGNDACTSCTTSLLSGPVVDGAAAGTVSLAPGGTFVYTPPSSTATGTVTFVYRTTDGSTGRSSDATVTINMADLAPDFATTANATPVSVPVQQNDPGCTNGCKPQVGTQAARGTATYPTGTGSARYAPTGALWGLDTFAYGITGNTASATTPVTVLVAPPAATLSTTYGRPATTALPADGSCTTCSYGIATLPTDGILTVDAATGTATYAPATGFVGTDAYAVSVRDQVSGLQVTGAVAVTVGPDAMDDTASVLLGSTVEGDVSANDSCPATCTRTLLAGPASGSLTFRADGTWTYAPGAGIGPVTFTYRVTSSVSGSVVDQAGVTVDVTGARDDTVTTGAQAPVDVDVRANDPCTGCTLASVGTPTAGTAEVVGGGVRYTPPPGFSGTATFGYELSSGGSSTTAQVRVRVLPLAVDDAVTTVVGNPVEVLPLTNDVCAACALTDVSTPGSGSTSRSGDVVRFVPTEAGSVSFGYSGADSDGGTVSGTVTVTVLAAPVLRDDAASTPAVTPVVVDVVADDDCAGCEVTIGSDPAHGSATVDVRGHVVHLPAAGFSGVDELTYVATDPVTGARASARLAVTVTPVAVDDAVATGQGVAVTADVLADDHCRGCTVTVGDVEGGATASVVDGRVLVEPDPSWVGVVRVGYTATDPSTGASSAAVLIVDVDDARPDWATTGYGQGVDELDVLANDTCPGCSVTAVGTPTWGTATTSGTPSASGSTVSWQPATTGPLARLTTFTYTAGDGSRSIGSTVRILSAPEVLRVPVREGQPVELLLVEADGCSGCTVSVRSSPEHGDLDPAGAGTFSYTPGGGTVMGDGFGYRVADPVSGRRVDGEVVLLPAATDEPVDPDPTPDPEPTPDPDPAPVPAPALAVTTVFGDPGARPLAGDVLPVMWTLSNTGDEPLSQVALTTASTGPVTCDETVLAVGTDLACRADLTLSQDDVDAGTVEVSARAAATGSIEVVQAADEAQVPLARVPGLDLVGEALAPADAGAGDEVAVTYTATNTGSTTLSEVVVLADDGPELTCDTTSAAPGADVVCRGTRTLTDDDLVAGSWSSTATATATSPGATEGLLARADTTTPLPGPDTTEPEPSPSPSEPEPEPSQTSVPPTAGPSPTEDPTPTVDPTPTTDPSPSPTDAPAPTPTDDPTPTADPTPSPTVDPTPSPTADPTPTDDPTPTTPVDPPVPGVSTVVGVAWFDRDRDGRRDAGEWPLPGVPVELVPTAAGARLVGHSEVAAAAETLQTVTGSDGSYRFTQVAPGRYTVRAAVTAPGFSYTSDSDGLADWSVQVLAPADGTAEADFAGLGLGTLGGAVYSSATMAPIADADVSCRWDGFDDVPGTDDDVVITLRAGADGSFELQGVAYGGYACSAVDPVTGLTATPATATVMSPTPVHTDLPITPTTTPDPTPTDPTPTDPLAPPTFVLTPTAPRDDVEPLGGPDGWSPGVPAGGPTSLARTGASTSSVLLLAVGLLLAGGVALASGRRPRSSTAVAR